MRTVGIYELKTHLAQLVDEVAEGETITITRHGVPVAQLVPPRAKRSQEEIAAAIEELRELRRGVILGDDITIKELIEEGRR
ncbi:MAG TPA: type II toxin-antitoxin system prevent-host-death family antitoxin [Thermomicrobiaceae bacterium]|nr:type II toxin-antitoxin system prevent-host-death family antitoxin [Thermomicrobiaceae bacterium]